MIQIFSIWLNTGKALNTLITVIGHLANWVTIVAALNRWRGIFFGENDLVYGAGKLIGREVTTLIIVELCEEKVDFFGALVDAVDLCEEIV